MTRPAGAPKTYYLKRGFCGKQRQLLRRTDWKRLRYTVEHRIRRQFFATDSHRIVDHEDCLCCSDRGMLYATGELPYGTLAAI